MTKTITISINELLYRIHKQSHEEIKAIESPAERYHSEASSGRDDMLKAFIREAFAMLTADYVRFFNQGILENYSTAEAKATGIVLTDVVLTMNETTARRYGDRLDDIGQAIMSYVVNLVLYRHYMIVGQTTLAEKRSVLSVVDKTTLDALFFRKTQPVPPARTDAETEEEPAEDGGDPEESWEGGEEPSGPDVPGEEVIDPEEPGGGEVVEEDEPAEEIEEA